MPETTLAMIDVTTIPPHPSNPKAHDLDALTASIRRLGFAEPIVVDQRTGLNVSGHGRVEALQAMRTAGTEPPNGVTVDDDGAWLAPVYVGWSSTDDTEAEAALVALNRIGETGGWHDAPLLEVLDRLADLENGLDGIGYDADTIDTLRTQLAALDRPDPTPPTPKPWPHRAIADATVEIVLGDSLEVLTSMDADSVDAIVCDPPYGISFMGRDWDTHAARDFAGWCQSWADAALRVVKPGGHLIAFGATRTHHRLMQGIEDAGWEIRDCGVWLYRSGFPKSLDVSKAIDKAAGVERQVVSQGGSSCPFIARGEPCRCPEEWKHEGRLAVRHTPGTAPATADAAEWAGWGTALKPAIEPWVLARRPITERNVAANVLRYGTGALNIDACRAEMTDEEREQWLRGQEAWYRRDLRLGDGTTKIADVYGTYGSLETSEPGEDGRWPANVVTLEGDDDLRFFRAAIGQVSDFAKAGSAEKPWDSDPAGAGTTHTKRCVKCGLTNFGSTYCTCPEPEWHQRPGAEVTHREEIVEELHPTVKPLELMRHLIRLVARPGGTILDPFAGSGTTGEAAIIEGVSAVLIEQNPAYVELIRKRIARTAGEEVADEVAAAATEDAEPVD